MHLSSRMPEYRYACALNDSTQLLKAVYPENPIDFDILS